MYALLRCRNRGGVMYVYTSIDLYTYIYVYTYMYIYIYDIYTYMYVFIHGIDFARTFNKCSISDFEEELIHLRLVESSICCEISQKFTRRPLFDFLCLL